LGERRCNFPRSAYRPIPSRTAEKQFITERTARQSRNSRFQIQEAATATTRGKGIFAAREEIYQ
jgi:hypothetical protein